MISKDREYRNMIMQIREAVEGEEDPGKVVTGYASTFDEPYKLYSGEGWELWEVVDRSAFDDTDMSDVIMQYNHEGRVFARVANNTLRVVPDERGLFIEADLGGTELGRQLYEEIKGGYTDKMSFGFVVNDDVETRTNLDDGRVEYTRTIRGISKLYDVSAVSIPANDATSISVRNLTDGVIDQIRAERLEAEALELRRRKLLAKARLNGGQK